MLEVMDPETTPFTSLLYGSRETSPIVSQLLQFMVYRFEYHEAQNEVWRILHLGLCATSPSVISKKGKQLASKREGNLHLATTALDREKENEVLNTAWQLMIELFPINGVSSSGTEDVWVD